MDAIRTVTRFVRPPAPLDERARRILPILVFTAFVTGYQGSILSTILTYPARQWGKTSADQTHVLALLRLDIVAALVIVRAADRFGRRNLLALSSLAAPIFTGLCATTNSLITLGILQFVSRALTTAVAILITVYVAEEFPTGTRGWATGMLVTTAAFGSGVLLVVASTADRSPGAWRFPFLLPLFGVPVLLLLFRGLEESQRFERVAEGEHHQVHRRATVRAMYRYRRRLLLVAFFSLAFAFEQAPARQLQNDFLRVERHFSAVDVSLFGILSNAPGLIGVMLSTLLCDRYGRRIFIVIGLAGFAIGDTGLFLTSGTSLWIASIFGALVGGLAIPALGVFTAELFPTEMRATANGIATAFGRVGGGAGLLFVGWLATSTTGPVIAMTTLALWAAIAIILLLPETAGRELPESEGDMATRPRSASAPIELAT